MANRSGRTGRLAHVLCGAVLGLALWVPTAVGAQTCAGDCDGSGSVAINELILGINVALDSQPLSACPAFDTDGSGVVAMPELTRALFARINGCAATPQSQTPSGGAGVVVQIGSGAGVPGGTASFSVSFDAPGESVAGIQNDITFSPETPIAARPNGRPDCAVNPAINKNGSAFVFRPSGCTVGVSCTGTRALVLALDNVDPIPNGAQLYTCNVEIAPAAPFGTYPLVGSNPGASDPNGQAIPSSIVDGSITVGAVATPTPLVTDAPATLILRKAKLRANVGIRLGRGLGRIKLEAAVNNNLPFGGLIDDIQAAGLQLTVSTSGASFDLPWDGADCTQRETRRGPMILCATDDLLGRRRVTFRPSSTPNVLTMKLIARRLSLRPPLAEDPVHASLVTSSFRRSDELGECVVKGAESDSKFCEEVGILPTPTGTDTATPTPTLTPTITGTATNTRTNSPTRTVTRTPTDTPPPTFTRTPTPLVVPTVPLGTRVFTIEPGAAFASPSGTRSGLFSSILSGGNAASSFSSGPLTLVGGLPDVDGVASLTLQDDVTLTLSIADGSYVCVKYLAAGSSGSIDCDGGTAYDVEGSQPAGDVGLAFTLQTGLGAPAGPGHGALLVMQQSQQVAAGPVPDCTTITYDNPPAQFGYTTTTATAIKGALTLAVNGEPFSCNDFATPSSGGMLAAPAPTTDPMYGDSANVFRLAEVATVERVFTVAPGVLLAPPEDPGSGLYTSALSGANAAQSFSPGPLTLLMGAQDANGVAPLRLAQDVTLSISIVDSTCLCLRLLEAGSDGSIDCDGGSAYDTEATRASGAMDLSWSVQTGLGSAAGPGNGALIVNGLFERVMTDCVSADCDSFIFPNPPNVFAFTTTTATAVQETSGSPITLAVSGAPFDCANFALSGSGGMLAAPAPTTFDPVGDVANVFRVSE